MVIHLVGNKLKHSSDIRVNFQKENADKEKEKEKQERIEASLREREREVRASQAELAKHREKEKEQHLRDKAEQHFHALLADMVRDCHVFVNFEL